MGRKRKRDKHLPDCVYKKHGSYWHVKGGKWKKLDMSLREIYSAMNIEPDTQIDFNYIWQQYKEEELITKAYDTQKNKQYHFSLILPVFGHMVPSDILTAHVAKFRNEIAKLHSNNLANNVLASLKSLLSWAAEQGFVKESCARGVKRKKTIKRDRYIENKELVDAR